MGIWNKLKNQHSVKENINTRQENYITIWQEDYLALSILPYEKDIALADLKINKKDFINSIEKFHLKDLPFKIEFKPEDNSKFHAYGIHQNAIFFETKEDIIQNIWIGFYQINQENVLLFSNVLQAIDLQYNVLLQDQAEGKTVDLKELKTIQNYLLQ